MAGGRDIVALRLAPHVQEAEDALIRQVQKQVHQERAGPACDRAIGQPADDGKAGDARRRDALQT